MAEADAALLVADDDERSEAEAPAALHHLGDAIDVHQLVDEFAVALFAVAVGRGLPEFSCHVPVPRSLRAPIAIKKFKTAFARGIRQRLDASVIDDSRRDRTPRP